MPNFNDHVKLAELAAGRFDARRNYEWKIVLGFWVVMLMTLHKDWTRPTMPACWAIALGFAVVILFTMTWIRGIWVANKNDKRRYEYYWWEAEHANQEPKQQNPLNKDKVKCCEMWCEFISDWNTRFQILASAGIVALVCYNFTQ